MPNVDWEFPKKLEIAMLVLMVFSLFLFDINLNKLSDKGMDYEVTVFGDMKIPALTLFWASIIVYHLLLIGIYTRAIMKEGTHYVIDYIVGAVQMFGTLILLSGAWGHFYFETINLGFTTIKTITYYHVGIALQVIGSFWWATTD